jgi:hypothetical protein
MSTRTGTYTDRWVVDRTLFEYVNQVRISYPARLD